MPYCTIEEAWGTNLTSNNDSDNRFKKVVPEMAFNNTNEKYSLDSYPETDIYDNYAKSIFSKEKNKKKVKKKKTFSRNYNRLPEHSGPKTRFSKNDTRKRLIINENNYKELNDVDNHPNYDNNDSPINDYDRMLEQKLNDGYESGESNESVSLENFENKENYVNFLKIENKKLKNLVKELQKISYNKNDNIFDLVVFISTGVFIIF